MTPDRVVAFGPGRVNLIGEHTDYNDGLSLPFAVRQGVRVTAQADGGEELVVIAADQDEQERFSLTGEKPRREGDWRDFVAGAVGELAATGLALRGGRLTIEGDVPQGSGMSSSAALEVSMCLALMALAGTTEPGDRVELARLCSRIENDWVGAHSGLLDQLACLLGERGRAVRIDFATLHTRTVPLELGDWRLAMLDSGESHSLATSGYNERRAECERARDLLGVASLRDARPSDVERLPDPLDRRVAHVLQENARVDAAVDALHDGDLSMLGSLLDASHASLRDLFDASTDAVEKTVVRLKEAGASGARMMGGGFGGAVIALLPPHATAPAGAWEVLPAAGARLLEVG